MSKLPLAAASIRWPCKRLGSRGRGQDQGWHRLCFDRLVGGIRAIGWAESHPLWCPMQRGPDTWRRLVLPHLEYASSGLDLITCTPSNDEGSCEGRITEIDR